MDAIITNPYRVVGLLVGATAREQERQIRRLNQFIEAEEDPQDDFSFPILGDLERTIENVAEAAAKLNLGSDKMNAALFWFYSGNEITDEAAFEAIKDGDIDTAVEIWRKLAYDSDDNSYNEVTKRNASAFHNLSTLYLKEYGIDEDTLQLKLLFLESDYFSELKNKATDETYKISKKELQLRFLNSLTHQEGIASLDFIDALSNIEFIAKYEFLQVFVQKPIEQLERLLNECKTHRKSKKQDAIVAGNNLYKQAKPILTQVKDILGKSDLKYTSISDKVSDEVLQCGIQLFNDYKDHETYDPGEPAMKVFALAKSLAVGSIAKQRCQENTENLQEWVDGKPERDKQARVLVDFEKLKGLIDEYGAMSKTVANAKLLLASSRLYLNNVKTALGATDELYLGLSSRIAADAQAMCVSEINKVQERFANTYENAAKLALISILKGKVNEAWDLTTTIGAMDLLPELRSRYISNRDSLSSLKVQLSSTSRREPAPQATSGEIPGWAWIVAIIILFMIIGQCNS